jgi:hypothetical protein
MTQGAAGGQVLVEAEYLEVGPPHVLDVVGIWVTVRLDLKTLTFGSPSSWTASHV